LLDEPLTALDAALRERLRGDLNRLLRALGITTIYVTHDQAEAMELGDRIVVMSKGGIAQIGTPRKIYFEPANRFVAEFIGAANIVEAPIRDGNLILPGGSQPVKAADVAHAVAMIRPETIEIVDASAAPLTGVVETIRFAGDRLRITVRDAASKLLSIDAPNGIALKVGDRVGLAIAADSVRLLPPESQ
jgi:putative spermidine/putrescine transport system ATP-binding protein